jgi:hypothetical protein
MELIQAGSNVLFVWHGQQVENLEQQVNDIKKIANVKVENVEILSQGMKIPLESSVCFVCFLRSLTSLIFKQHRIQNRHST